MHNYFNQIYNFVILDFNRILLSTIISIAAFYYANSRESSGFEKINFKILSSIILTHLLVVELFKFYNVSAEFYSIYAPVIFSFFPNFYGEKLNPDIQNFLGYLVLFWLAYFLIPYPILFSIGILWFTIVNAD